MLVTDSNDSVTALNIRARTDLIFDGTVNALREVERRGIQSSPAATTAVCAEAGPGCAPARIYETIDDMTEISDEETLRRFVRRARRIGAHSLVQDRDSLLDHATGEFKGRIDHSGQMTFTQRLPDNEEVFESLASRLRPLTIKSEPVYHTKVFDAIENLLGDAEVGESGRGHRTMPKRQTTAISWSPRRGSWSESMKRPSPIDEYPR